MLEEEYYRIAEVEHEHWWYKSLHNLVLSHIKRHFDSQEITIIDAGCGTGGLISFLKSKGYNKISGFDHSDLAVKISKEKNISVFKGDIREISKYYKENCADVIISNDTFYFFDMDIQRKVTDDMSCLLRKDGLLITNMPSLKAFRGIHDLQVGIRERFDRKDTWKIFDRNKYSSVTEMYWPFIMSPVIWLSRYIQRLKMKFNPLTPIRSDVKNEGRIINSILFSITKMENNFLNKKPFGSSLFLVMKKK